MSNFCSSKFKKSDLNRKMVALHLPPELNNGKSIGVIGKMRAEENTLGDVWVIVDYGFESGGQIIGGKLELGTGRRKMRQRNQMRICF